MPNTRRNARSQTTAALAVLILDDERFDRHRLTRFCSALEQTCDVTSAASLSEFDALVDTAAFDLILVDYMLPDGTGLQALDSLRRSPRNFQSATIMITGQMDEEVAQAAIRGGCAEYLPKEALTRDSFLRTVASVLKRSALTMEVTTQSFARSDVEAVLEVFASRLARDIKPMVSRTLRQLRDQRSTHTANGITEIEGSCMAIWETLVELERASGTEMMKETLHTPAAHTLPPVETIRKPPSPFARISN